jgi:lipopolysaccharide export LptBFGC system permease protein LptF
VILQRYIFRELLASFLFAFAAVLMVCMLGTMFQVFRTFPGLGFKILATALPLATGAMASWVILVSSSTSSTLVYARLAAENEITAMRACGIHTGRILAPALLLGLLLVCAAYPLNEFVVPWTRWYKRVVFRQSTVEALKAPPAGNQEFLVANFRLRYTDFQNGQMLNPTITQLKATQVVMDYVAPSGRIVAGTGAEPVKVIMLKPRYWRMSEKGKKEMFSAENEVTIEIPLEDYESGGPQMVDLPADRLWDIYFGSSDRTRRNQALLVLHTRYASSLAPLLLVLVAVPIGILVKKGSRLAGLGASLPPLLIYFVSYFVFQGLGDKGKVHVLLASYAPDLFLSALAAGLLLGVARK